MMTRNWYETSIKDLFEDYLRSKGYEVEFDTTKFFLNELKGWTVNMSSSEREIFTEYAYEARNYAFNKKYGAYNYSNDFRSECPNWTSFFMLKMSQYKRDLKNLNVLAVGSNNGSELYQIFGYESGNNFEVVEISEDAVKEGIGLCPSITFHHASMDIFEPKENYFDIYLNLRAAYCAGNDLDLVVSKAFKSLKLGGLVVFSISNGYIDISSGERKIVKGIYNPANKECNYNETNSNLEWVKAAMQRNGFKNVEIFDVESEILLISTKK